jgi:hypothetical protein
VVLVVLLVLLLLREGVAAITAAPYIEAAAAVCNDD